MFITVDQAIIKLRDEQIVALPTETVYGLAGLATSNLAIDKIYQAKNRPRDNPLICHFYNLEQILEYVEMVPSYVNLLSDNFCPGPLSFLLKLKSNSPLLAATLGSEFVVCRIPNHPIFLQVIQSLNIPLAAPSANTSTRVSPTSAWNVEQDLGSKINGVVDGGNCEVGLESTIIDCRENNRIIILRPGKIGQAEINELFTKNNVGNIEIINQPKKVAGSDQNPQVIPGNKYRHYSPKTIIKPITFSSIENLNANSILIGTKEDVQILKDKFLNKKFVYLSLGRENDLNEISQNLYQVLFEVDKFNQKQAYWYEFDINNSSIGLAIKDKLKKILTL